MTLSLRATPGGGGVILSDGVPRLTVDATGNLVGTLTPAPGDKSFNLANTEFVNSVMGSYRGYLQVNSALVLSAAQIGVSLQMASAASQITLPLANSVPAGSAYHVINTWSTAKEVFKQAADTLYAGGSLKSSLSLGFGESATIVSNGANIWFVVAGTELLKTADMFGSSKARNGWQKLPGGLIIQWGRTPDSAASDIFVPFPIAFPNAYFSLTFGNDSVGAQNLNVRTTTQSVGLGGFFYAAKYSGSSANISGFGADFITIGY